MATVTAPIDNIDRRLLNLLQASLPLVPEPYADLGRRVNISGQEAIERVLRLKGMGLIKWISGVFDSRKLGYQSTLVAIHLPGERIDEAAEIINRHPGVSHNYGRTHYFNLWFTLTVSPAEDIIDVINLLTDQVEAEDVMNLPAVRVFKIRVYFDLTGKEDTSKEFEAVSERIDEAAEVRPLSHFEKRLVRMLTDDLPVTARPFDHLAQKAATTPDELLGCIRSLQSSDILRRLGALLGHREAGFPVNVLSCWAAPDHLVQHAGMKMASYSSISHCYERRTDVGWPYNLYAMIHCRHRNECHATARQLSLDTTILNYQLLLTTREYKKERIRYFADID
ncbi:MAG: Lrp/AsnC family transcriptional regulator [Dehalococcoidia bacterium]|nr:Lrp/AsnC family transcriptional regulator [Dehalococcoidia bacterium]